MERDAFSELLLIDWPLAYERVANKQTLARELFALFVARLPRDKTALMEHFTHRNWPGLQDSIHAMNGASSYCGVPRLEALGKSIETALKRQEYTTVDGLWPLFVETLDALVQHPT